MIPSDDGESTVCPGCPHPPADHEVWGCRRCPCDVIAGRSISLPVEAAQRRGAQQALALRQEIAAACQEAGQP